MASTGIVAPWSPTGNLGRAISYVHTSYGVIKCAGALRWVECTTGAQNKQWSKTEIASTVTVFASLSFWNIFVKSQGLRPKSQGFFMYIFQTSRVGGFRGWKVCIYTYIYICIRHSKTQLLPFPHRGITRGETISKVVAIGGYLHHLLSAKGLGTHAFVPDAFLHLEYTLKIVKHTLSAQARPCTCTFLATYYPTYPWALIGLYSWLWAACWLAWIIG